MNAKNKSDVEIFVHNKSTVMFSCPHCRLEKAVNTSDIKDVSHWNISAVCTRCEHQFTVSFNFRKYYRKKTSIKGVLYSTQSSSDPVGDVVITDISLTGVGFDVERGEVNAKDVLVLRFILEVDDSVEIMKRISVESIRGHKVGASFVEEVGFDKHIGKYILKK